MAESATADDTHSNILPTTACEPKPDAVASDEAAETAEELKRLVMQSEETEVRLEAALKRLRTFPIPETELVMIQWRIRKLTTSLEASVLIIQRCGLLFNKPAAIAQPQPTVAIAQPQPTVAIAQPQPTAAIAQPQPAANYKADAERLMQEIAAHVIASKGVYATKTIDRADGYGTRALARYIRANGSLRIIPAFIQVLGKTFDSTRGSPTVGWLSIEAILACLAKSDSEVTASVDAYPYTVDDIDILFSYYVSLPEPFVGITRILPFFDLIVQYGSLAQIRRGKKILGWHISSRPGATEKTGKLHRHLAELGFSAHEDIDLNSPNTLYKTIIARVIYEAPPDTFKERIEEVMRGINPKLLASPEEWSWYIRLASLAGRTDVKERIAYYLQLPLIR